MKMTFGRKFWAGLFGLLLLMFMFLIGVFCTDATTSAVLVTYAILEVTIVFMYIGGNVWKSWVKSRYFRSELSETQFNSEVGE